MEAGLNNEIFKPKSIIDVPSFQNVDVIRKCPVPDVEDKLSMER